MNSIIPVSIRSCLLASIVLPNISFGAHLIGGGRAFAQVESLRSETNSAIARPAAADSLQGAVVIGASERPALEGPVMTIAIAVTDQRDGEFEFFATPHTGVTGSALPGATTNVVFGLLDSGSSTHLFSYPDALGVGLGGSFLSGNTFQVSGADGGVADLDLSVPVGCFAHGIQDLDSGGHPQPSLMLGQGNFACGVNTLANVGLGIGLPTLVGAPFLYFYPAYIRNSALVQSGVLDTDVSSPSITFYDDPLDPQLPVLAHKIFMEVRPIGASGVAYVFLFDGLPIAPSTILGASAGSLFFTASAMSFHEGANGSSGKMVVDTGAQATLLSEIAAAELGLDLPNPDFEVEVQGIVNTVTAPGFYIDSASIPAGGGAVSWTNVPVIILNVASPEGGTLYGILGNNLTASRDLVFNGAAEPPYLSVTDPIVSPRIKITGIRRTGPDSAEVDWHAEPAQPVLHLERCTALGSATPNWTVVATNPLPTINGTMSVTGLTSPNFFRLKAPQ